MTPQENYGRFLEFIGDDVQKERQVANRRMLFVLIWGFLVPALVSGVLLWLVRTGMVPLRFKSYAGWVGIFFPLIYTVYVLASEVLVDIPALFRRGGIVSTLRAAEKDSKWRDRVVLALLDKYKNWKPEDWGLVLENFEIDLEALKARTRYLTAFAGAVFFLILQGIDTLSDDTKVSWVRTRPLGWIEQNNVDVVQYVGFGFVLLLVYLTGSQTHRLLLRYLYAAKLAAKVPVQK